MRTRLFVALSLLVVGLFVIWKISESRTAAAAAVPAQVVTARGAVPVAPSREQERPMPARAMAGATRAIEAAKVIASVWSDAAQPEFAAFREWTTRFVAASPADRAALLREGVELARARREVLRELIRTDPRAALAAAVPMAVRAELPTEIVALLEERVSGSGVLALNAAVPIPGGAPLAEPVFRAALIGREEYRAFVYGRREVQATVPSATLNGIALDHRLAVSESPIRVLEAGEISAATTATTVTAPFGAHPTTSSPIAVEIAGRVQVLCCAAHLAQLEAKMIAAESGPTAADNQPGTSTVAGRPPQSWTHGVKKVLIIRVDFSDRAGTPTMPYGGEPITDTFVANLINGAGGVRDFYEQSSFGKTTLQVGAPVNGDSPDVTNVLRMPATAQSYANSGNTELLHNDARAAATTAGVNVASYDRVIVVFPYIGPDTSIGGFTNSQLTFGGLGNITGTSVWVNGFFDFRIVAHELGHTYGLSHSNLWKVTDGNPVSLTAGSSLEYGDPFDLMGLPGDFTNDFSHWNKSLLQWIPDSGVTVVQTSGTYRVYRFDASGADLTRPRALKLPRDATRDYWIGYRRALNNNSTRNGAYVIWGYNTNRQGDLLDLTTPGTAPEDAALALNTTFNDTAAGISMRPIAQGGTGAEEYLDVQVTLQPRITWASTSYSVSEQAGSAVLTVRRLANSTGAVSVNYATSPGTATSPADFTATSGTLTWADGDSADKTITIPIIADAITEGLETFTVTLTGVTGGVIGAPASATVSIADPGVVDASFKSDFMNNTVTQMVPLADGSVVVAGWFDSVQDASFTSYTRSGITRVLASGQLDPTFASGAGASPQTNYVDALLRQPDGKFIIVGRFTSFHGVARNRIARLNSDGTLDTTFNPGTGPNGSSVVYAAVLQPDGKLVLGGNFTSFNGVAREYLVRLNSDGSVDTGWTGPNFADISGWWVESLAMQADGKIVVGGSFYFSGGATFKAGLCRILASGALDSSFSGVSQGAHLNGDSSQLRTVQRLLVQPDGRIIIAGGFTAYNGVARSGLARVTTTGALDPDFAPQPNGTTNALLQLPDSRLLVAGTFTSIGGISANRLALLSSGGVGDASFSAAAGYSSQVECLSLLPDGRVMLGGWFATYQGGVDARPLWRFFSGFSGTPGTVQFAADTYTGTEGSSVQLLVTRSGSGNGALTVGYSTVSGTAGTADFTTTAGTLTWANGDVAAKTISVPLTTDALTEGVETFTVNLGQPLIGGAILGSVQRASVEISDPDPTGYAAFRAQYFSPTELNDATVSGPNADPDADGLANLVEYALGFSPRVRDTAPFATVTNAGGNWTFTYTRPTGRTDVTYAAEVSTTLSSWTTSGVTHALVSSSNGVETWSATYPSGSAPVLFFRLRVTSP